LAHRKPSTSGASDDSKSTAPSFTAACAAPKLRAFAQKAFRPRESKSGTPALAAMREPTKCRRVVNDDAVFINHEPKYNKLLKIKRLII
jgi:hypothetical protein